MMPKVIIGEKRVEEKPMPVYEYFCRRCEKLFTMVMHVSEHESTVPECPECKRPDEVEKRMSTFTAVTSRKSAGL
jgi:putative FmdB family regulatory protein